MHQKIINLFIEAYTATYIKSNLRVICANKNVHCAVNFKYKMVNNSSLRVILQGYDLNVLNDIESKLKSLNGEEIEYELIPSEPEANKQLTSELINNETSRKSDRKTYKISLDDRGSVVCRNNHQLS